MSNIKVKKLSTGAQIPTKAEPGAAGFDLYANEVAYLRPGEITRVGCGVAVEIPPGWEGQVRGRSGLASRGIWVTLGTIDSSYRGEIGAIMTMVGSVGFAVIQKGDRIAQLVICPAPEFTLVETQELSNTERGTKGFGSTGK
jgi:dUTP pyrophosphatase